MSPPLAAFRTTVLALAAAAALVLPLHPAVAASTRILVNEVSAYRTYVELRNVRSQPADISGWSLWVCRASGPLRLVTVPRGEVVPAQGSYLVVGSRFPTSTAADLQWSGKRDEDGFPSVRLTDATGAVVDQVGVATGNPCVEGSRASYQVMTASPDRFALGRSTATDTDDNSRDFSDVAQSPTASGARATPLKPMSPISMVRDPSVRNESHTIEAVVTGIDDRSGSSYDAIYPEDRGLFVQEEPADHDADPATSEGVFVAGVARPSDYRPGDVVKVTGTVTDKFGLRIITYGSAGSGVPSKTGSAPVPDPVSIDPARARAEGAAYFETLEGMRVRLAEGTANSGGTNKFGELFVTTGGERQRFFRTDPRKDLLGIADDAGAGNPANAYKDRRSSTRIEADLFDQLDDVVGPLGFSYESYKIYPQPGAMPRIRPYAGKPYPVRLAASRPGQVRIASFNVENFFPAGVPIGGPNAGNTPQGAPSEEEYAEQRDEILTALDDVLGRPDVVAVQEVYADNAGSTPLTDLATRLSRGSETYTAYVARSNDGRGIANGYLVKSTLTARNPRLLGASEASSVCEAGKLFARPPYAIDVDFGGRTVTLLNNHFKSKGGQDQGVPCREAQASYLRARIAEIEAVDGEAIVLGDLNSFEDETPLAILTDRAATSMTNLWSQAPEDTRYSYAFQGRLQTLDHMVVTDTVAANVLDFRYATIDTDYADRTTAQGHRVVDGHGLSDHNPPVLTLPAALDEAPPPVVPEAPWPALLVAAGSAAALATVARRRGAG